MFPIMAGNSASTGYNLTRSLRFRASATAWLGRTPATTTNQQTWTFSAWFKRGTLTVDIPTLFSAAIDGNNFTCLTFADATTGYLTFVYVVGGVDTVRLVTNQVFRDPSAWYHIVAVADTTNATASNRMKLYINGVQITSFSYASYPAQNTNLFVNSANYHGIGITRAVGRYYDGYMTEINLIDGQALTPSSFGSTNALTGVWQPARYTGSYGTNGFYLPFTDNSALTTSSNVGLGKDFSGNGNYWTTNNISITAGVTYDSMTDVPTLTSATAANFCTWNPVDPNLLAGGSRTISNGNLTVADASTTYGLAARGTFWQSSGKWYWEINCTSIGDIYGNLGFCDASNNGVFYQSSGQRNPTAVNTGTTSYGASYTTGDVVGVALDLNANSVTFYKNNVSQGTVSFSAGTYTPAVGDGANTSTYTWDANFGQRPFTYTPPSGFLTLNTYNIPTSTILKGNSVMDATLYTGTLLSNPITNAAAFKPDLVWVKSRSAATDNKLTDSVRGVTKGLISNTTGAETTDTQGLTAFNTNGFTVGTNTDYNNLAGSYVGWQWQAGQGSTSSNTNGSITSTVSVNASAGFSVVTATSPASGNPFTLGHGLGVALAFIIAKSRSGSGNWSNYHVSTGAGGYLLFTTGAFTANTDTWNNTAPTSSVISTTTNWWGFSTSLVFYCWTPIAGYSAFGSYTGNGSTDGTFVYTGFRPKFVLFKRTDTTGDWLIEDTARSTFNQMDARLFPYLADAEVSNGNGNIDYLSNGFKLRNSTASMNASGGTYIYMAFAENPFKNSLAR